MIRIDLEKDSIVRNENIEAEFKWYGNQGYLRINSYCVPIVYEEISEIAPMMIRKKHYFGTRSFAVTDSHLSEFNSISLLKCNLTSTKFTCNIIFGVRYFSRMREIKRVDGKLCIRFGKSSSLIIGDKKYPIRVLSCDEYCKYIFSGMSIL